MFFFMKRKNSSCGKKLNVENKDRNKKGINPSPLCHNPFYLVSYITGIALSVYLSVSIPSHNILKVYLAFHGSLLI